MSLKVRCVPKMLKMAENAGRTAKTRQLLKMAENG
jgi:hypothetical protein